ncbi:MAG: hypothetical protein K2L90_09355 [Muribaculaceae bacterium]|nr:hypothetical protein [Muribaculaceae bacterium]
MRNLLLTITISTASAASAGTVAHGRHLAAYTDWESVDSTCYIDYKRPVHYPMNPIIKADKPWELNAKGDPYAAPFSGGVYFDEQDRKFKMWYSAGGGKTDGLVTCYAVSDNGIDWIKPVLDIVYGTNIVDTDEHDCVTVLMDRHEQDPAKRFKMFAVVFNNPSSVSMVLKYSPDGIHWSEPKALSGELYDRCSAYFDPLNRKYVLSLKTMHPTRRRSRAYIMHEDPEMAVSLAHRVYHGRKDKHIRYWFNADSLDMRHPQFPDIHPQIYNHDATPYERGLIGQFVIWQGPENPDCNRLNIQKRNEVMLGWSDDGLTWKRPDRHAFIAVNDSLPGAWNSGNIQSVAGNPVIAGDSLYFYFSGRYESKPEHASNFATGLARLRRDGFAALQGSGYALSAPIPAEGTVLYVNADCSNGDISVEVIDNSGIPIGRGRVPYGTDSTALRIGTIPEINEPVRLRFHLTGNPQLYAYWLDESD